MERTRPGVTSQARDRRHERRRWLIVARAAAAIAAAAAVLAVVGDWWRASLLLFLAALAYMAHRLRHLAVEGEAVEEPPSPGEASAAMDRADAAASRLETTLSGRTLAEALEAYAGRLGAEGVRIRVHGAAPGVGPHVAAQGYRLGTEAMTSALSHAHADLIDVAVDADDERLRLLVTDNGTRPDAGQEEAPAIAAMRARARSLGGRLELVRGRAVTAGRCCSTSRECQCRRPRDLGRRRSSGSARGTGPPDAAGARLAGSGHASGPAPPQ